MCHDMMIWIAQVETVKSVLQENLAMAIDRGDQLQSMEEKSETLMQVGTRRMYNVWRMMYE